MALFFPQLREYLDPDSITFLDKEIFTDVTMGEQYETDPIGQVRFAQKDAYFLIHIENQSSRETGFDRTQSQNIIFRSLSALCWRSLPNINTTNLTLYKIFSDRLA